MAGHSQFKNIMYRKGAQDKKRGKIFTKLIRELTTAARSGLPDPNADAMLEAAIEAGAEDVTSDDDGHVVVSAPDDLNSVRDALEQRFGPAIAARLAWRPKASTTIDEETTASVVKLLETLEDSDDVQEVYANFEVGE